MNHNREKVLVIGLDGATFDIINPLIKQGKLPHLALLMKRGTSSPLKSTIMPNSFPAWVTCTTGVNPGKHGIFWSLIRTESSSYRLKLMSSADIRAKRLWHLLGERGYQVGVVNLPTEYPPEKVNGFLVCGALTPGIESEFTYPDTLREEILAAIPHYRCEIDFARADLKELARKLIRSIENHEKLVLQLLEKKPWNLLFAVFTETDIAQHKYWAAIDAKHPEHARLKKSFGMFIYQVYERLDQAIGRITARIGEDTVVLVISDHGFGPYYQSFSLPRWLIEKKYLVLKESPARTGFRNILLKIGMLDKVKNGQQYLRRCLLPSRCDLNARYLREKEANASEHLVEKVDWGRSRAYFGGDQGIRLNLKGREPRGIVSPGREENALKEEIKAKLRELTYSNGRPVYEEIIGKEEVFSGPFRDLAPDLIILIDHSQAPPLPEKWKFRMVLPGISGAHSPLGIFIAAGPGIKQGSTLRLLEITDVTPTILFMLGQPMTLDMDGKVMTEVFTPEFCRQREERREGHSLKPSSEEGVYSREGKDIIMERLKALGYID